MPVPPYHPPAPFCSAPSRCGMGKNHFRNQKHPTPHDTPTPGQKQQRKNKHRAAPALLSLPVKQRTAMIGAPASAPVLARFAPRLPSSSSAESGSSCALGAAGHLGLVSVP